MFIILTVNLLLSFLLQAIIPDNFRQRPAILEIQDEKPRGQIALVAGPVEIYLPLSGLVDLKVEEKRLSNELAETDKQIKRLEELLSSPFAQKAPENVVNNEKDKLAGYRETAATLKDQLDNLKDLE